MPASPAQVAEAALWVQQYSVASETLKENAVRAAEAAWLAFGGWYDATQLARMAGEMTKFTLAAQQTTSGLSAQYMAGVLATTTGARPQIPGNTWSAVRGGVDLFLVNHRPAEAYKRAIARGFTHEEALQRAVKRAGNNVRSDMILEDRQTQAMLMERAGITTYRRIIRPELSVSGTCGLCIVAADRVYTTGNLMPIHPPSCRCVVMPIVGDKDPGISLTREDLDRLYEEAGGSTKAKDLARTRYRVDQHGEFGPVLSFAKDEFRGPEKVLLENDPPRAKRMLEQIAPVLATLQQRDAAGENVDGPLEYQRALFARLTAIVGDDAA